MGAKIALLMGDRNGIGPEIVAKVLAAPRPEESAGVVVVGDPDVFAAGQRTAGVAVKVRRASRPEDIEGGGDGPVLLEWTPEVGIETRPGEADTASGREMIAVLEHAVGLARDGTVGGFAYAPLNKQALHAAGMGFEDEFGLVADALGFDGVRGELNVIDGLGPPASRPTCRLSRSPP